MIRLLCASLTLLAALAVGLPADATVVFSDSFARTEGFDTDPSNTMNFSSWGDNDNALGGSAVQTYSMDTSRGGGAQNTVNGAEGVIKNGAVQINTDFAALAPIGFTATFDFTRTTGNGFVAVALGLDDTNQIATTPGFNGNSFLFTTAANGADTSALFRQTNAHPTNGTLELRDDLAAVSQTIDAFYANRESTQSVILTVDAPSGYGAGAPGTLTVQIGAMTASQAFVFDGLSSGYLSIYSNQTGTRIDNLVVTATIPEPTSAVLALAFAGVATLRRRVR
ncbi:hypothetical protein [Botrimarina hoheduenensis]|uniref:PEP-CTERM protein-sorting domain-containing protein n=1 Tax=Botrimarina hoheduenensis TaxID=2528000 RepID=A0A5C5VYR7_9BACT|nr:hypothetical protein [Botrimarina hoheduenensis]TWT42891.1 hypothetical protein Pla111_25290 [Botrimarina hoheduenensis]